MLCAYVESVFAFSFVAALLNFTSDWVYYVFSLSFHFRRHAITHKLNVLTFQLCCRLNLISNYPKFFSNIGQKPDMCSVHCVCSVPFLRKPRQLLHPWTGILCNGRALEEIHFSHVPLLTAKNAVHLRINIANFMFYI